MYECKPVSTGNGSVTVTDENSVVAMTMTMLVADADDSVFSCFSLVLAKLLFQPNSTQRRMLQCKKMKCIQTLPHTRSILFGMRSASEKEDGKRILNIMQSERVHKHITHTHTFIRISFTQVNVFEKVITLSLQNIFVFPYVWEPVMGQGNGRRYAFLGRERNL